MRLKSLRMRAFKPRGHLGKTVGMQKYVRGFVWISLKLFIIEVHRRTKFIIALQKKRWLVAKYTILFLSWLILVYIAQYSHKICVNA